MLQWITAFEKAKASSNYANPRGNRFDSFAPIRLNVAAQWLVDGVSPLLLVSGSWLTDGAITARLFLESFSCDPPCTRIYLHP